MVNLKQLNFFFLFLFSISFVSAVALDNPNIPIVKPDDINFDQNITVNVSVDSAKFWDTSDYGKLGAVSDLMHNWLGGLQGGSANEYYHINSSEHTYLVSNIYDWVTASDIDSAVLWEVQPSNNSLVRLKTPRHINMSENDLYVKDIYASNQTLYLGNSKLQGGNGNVEVVGGNFTAATYFGSGEYLTDLNLTDINIDGGNITANYIEAINELVLANQSINNWSQLPQYFIFGDDWNYVSNNAWYFNESKLNESFGDQITSELANYYNITEIDAKFIPWTNESSLNVNSSIYWNNLNTINTTVLENNGGILNIVMSFFTDLFYTKEEVNNSFIRNTGYNYLNGTLNVTNIFAENIDVLNLTADQIYAIDIVADTIDVVNMTVEDLTASTIFARNFTVNGTPEGFCLSDGTGCENVTPNINGIAPWIITIGGNISFNETELGVYTYNQSEIDGFISNISLTPGPQGIPGVNGTDGTNGTDGIDGINGTNGIDGINGTNGIDGINGTNGIDGINGTNGIDGLNGTNGIDGINGTNGINGIDGLNGTNGIDGLNGTNGTNGIDGINGTNGINGTDGINGTFQYSLNDTQFNNVSSIWSIDLSWLTSWINSWFSTKTTDDLSEGSINKYDNQSWNQSLAEELFVVVLKEEVINVVSSGGVASATTSILDFEIKEIKVNTTSGTKFRFEAVGATSGDMIDKNRKLHNSLWIIEKNIPIAEAINISITSANPDDSFTITFKYLDNGF